jgi:hypothetical protein
MLNNDSKSTLHQSMIPKPYCSVGAGRLTSFVWKTGDQNAGWRYQFNLFRLAANGGRVSQLFAPADLIHFAKLTQVLAAVIADDGCLSPLDRGVLKRLAADLDQMLSRAAKHAADNANTTFESGQLRPNAPNNPGRSANADTTDS